ncbi:ROK family protein [Halobacillus sp. A5]|nr:ROK family protein [Halobacillus sp. A5]MCP3028753.1 ROK family protein [Halobacillus sp. A5]
MFGAIEAGGTKFVCAVGDDDYHIIDFIEFPTQSPKETMDKVKGFFGRYNITSMGIGSFGPLDIDYHSETYGCITTTPKVQWRNFNILDSLKETMDKPMVIHTDVTMATLGEAKFGAAQGLSNCIYVTIGTGVGVGAIINDQPLQGMSSFTFRYGESLGGRKLLYCTSFNDIYTHLITRKNYSRWRGYEAKANFTLRI